MFLTVPFFPVKEQLFPPGTAPSPLAMVVFLFFLIVPFHSFPRKNNCSPGSTHSPWNGRVPTFFKIVPFVPVKEQLFLLFLNRSILFRFVKKRSFPRNNVQSFYWMMKDRTEQNHVNLTITQRSVSCICSMIYINLCKEILKNSLNNKNLAKKHLKTLQIREHWRPLKNVCNI